MTKAPKNFAEIVKEVRQQLGLSQEELAQELGVSFSSINRWENSKTVPFKLKFDSSIICWMDNYLKILIGVPENREKVVPQTAPEKHAIAIITM